VLDTFAHALQAEIIYKTIEESNGFYKTPVEVEVRSCMNVPFTIPSNSHLEATFIKEAEAAGFVRPHPPRHASTISRNLR
jgi:phosphoserine aminotransferase